MKYNNVTILVQGPIHENSLSCIDYYSKLCKTVISCYDTCPTENIKNAIIVKGTYPLVEIFNGTNIFRQVFTTLNGLQVVDTDIVIKTRSDECWNNIELFIEKVINNPEVYTTCNIYYKGKPEPLHPSDHLIGTRTKYLLKGFSLIRDICISYFPNANHLTGQCFNLPNLNWGFAVETSLFLGFLYAKNILHLLNNENMHQIMYDNTELFNIDDMKPYIWTCKTLTGRKFWNDSNDLYHTYPSLKNKNEFWKINYNV